MLARFRTIQWFMHLDGAIILQRSAYRICLCRHIRLFLSGSICLPYRSFCRKAPPIFDVERNLEASSRRRTNDKGTRYRTWSFFHAIGQYRACVWNVFFFAIILQVRSTRLPTLYWVKQSICRHHPRVWAEQCSEDQINRFTRSKTWVSHSVGLLNRNSVALFSLVLISIVW
jgi:hypothetical protein